MNRVVQWAIAVALALPAVAHAEAPAWVAKSDVNSMVLLRVMAEFAPEDASSLGLEGYDERVRDLGPDYHGRYRRAVTKAIVDLERRRAKLHDPLLLQDLDITLKAAHDEVRETDLAEKYRLPYFACEKIVFGGLRDLLDAQVKPERRALAVTRLRSYAGLVPGTTPLCAQAEARTREKLAQPGLLPPVRKQLEKDLANSAAMVNGIEQLFVQFKVDGWQWPLAAFKAQLAQYQTFVRTELLPKAREDFRLPPELYAFQLEQLGVDLPPAELAKAAHAAFDDIIAQMKALAPEVAKQRHWKSTDYRDVLRALKKEQLVGAEILPFYQQRLHAIEEIITREHLVTLPARPARIRLATEAESAQTPIPNMRPPRLVHNTGEQGEFVLPLNIPAPPGSKEATQKLDDFTYSAAAWTLVAHEARPGHELQFDNMIEHGVSLARAVFAFNSTNVEGWGLYSEAIMLPYMPAEGQLVSLQLRLQRAARAFLDPELQAGIVTPAQAKKVLTDQVMVSEGLANSEVERYTFRSPGQATSYFYGFMKLEALRHELEQKLGPKLEPQKLHDFILAQGLLPPALMRKAVLEQFAP
jgi:uncharacterized protein (DUF885 family)